jgi:hypothetical protein
MTSLITETETKSLRLFSVPVFVKILACSDQLAIAKGAFNKESSEKIRSQCHKSPLNTAASPFFWQLYQHPTSPTNAVLPKYKALKYLKSSSLLVNPALNKRSESQAH